MLEVGLCLFSEWVLVLFPPQEVQTAGFGFVEQAAGHLLPGLNACSTEDLTEQRETNHDEGMAVKQPMRLFVDICIHDVFFPDEFQVNLL
jgi:hypothetical protein